VKLLRMSTAGRVYKLLSYRNTW